MHLETVAVDQVRCEARNCAAELTQIGDARNAGAPYPTYQPQAIHLPPGRYTAAVTAAGFTRWEQKNIDIEGTDIRTIYPKLTVGAAQSTVEVTANSSAVETTSGTISRTLEQQTVSNAPLVGVGEVVMEKLDKFEKQALLGP